MISKRVLFYYAESGSVTRLSYVKERYGMRYSCGISERGLDHLQRDEKGRTGKEGEKKRAGLRLTTGAVEPHTERRPGTGLNRGPLHAG